jgi:tRNA U55 pseudouridine synthase TruB
MPVKRDTQCPKRGPGLWHTTDGTITCVHCGATTYDRSENPGLAGAYGMAQFIAALRGERTAEPEEPDRVDHSNLTEAQWHRAVMVRSRYEAGKVTEWPATVQLTPEERSGLQDFADALMRLFRRVE